jgi:putative FmdB family regulatory protein
MPLYEYECLECGLRFDRLQRLGGPEPVFCPNGHPQVHRLLSQPAIIFKGSGFYVTDNRRSSVQKPANGGQQKKEKESTSE